MNFRLIINLHNATDERQPTQKGSLGAGFHSLKDEGAHGNSCFLKIIEIVVKSVHGD
jgi:hypothetical protein